MIFFVAMGVVFALLNLIIPLQIGARDVAFPFLNALSFWLFAAGAMLTLLSLAIGKFSTSGWLAYPPLSGLEYSPGEGVDYWIWAVQISGVGSTLSGVNFLVTILKNALPRHDLDENANLRLECLMRNDSYHLRFSYFDSHSLYAYLRSLPLHAFLYGKWRRQFNDVYQSYLGMGASRSLHSCFTYFWSFF